MFDYIATVRLMALQLLVMTLVEKGCGKNAGEWVVRQKDSWYKEQQKGEKQKRKWMGKRKLDLSS